MTHPTPDHLEEELADLIDDPIPTRGYTMTPMVGLGGSAGALPALQEFFSSMETPCGMAFVVVLHLAADRDSIVADILQRHTSMKVMQVKATVKVDPDTVYVIPPGKAIKSVDGFLSLTDLEPTAGKRVAVDLFFRALADTHGPHSGAVVLSGGDGDGTIGIKRIKERGGLTIAQDPAQAEHPNMPSSAIATGMVDWVLPVAEIPGRLTAYYGFEKRLRLPSEDGPQPARAPRPRAQDGDDGALQEVLSFLRARTGRDFSYYKRATIVRRIARRMQVNNVPDLPGYLDCMRMRSGEAAALLQDLLISVTNFFRDAECFAALESRIASLFENKGPGDAVRVWVAACATGEEAYSIAMLLSEHARTLKAPPVLQVFATDLDEDAVQTARTARYPAAIEADVSPERLQRFFMREHHGYCVRRELREMVLFATHDLLKDSPFSRLDLMSCRNLLIYLDPEAQRHALDIMSFSVLHSGILFLGVSEAVDQDNPHFAALDKKHRLYARRSAPRQGLPLPSGPSSLALAVSTGNGRALHEPVIAGSAFHAPTSSHGPQARRVPNRSAAWGEMHLKLLEHLAPPSILVDAQNDVVHLSPGAGRYLHHHAGEPSRNLLQLVMPALRIELRTALHQASQSGNEVRSAVASHQIDGVATAIAMRVVPAHDQNNEFKLVIFEPAPPAPTMLVGEHDGAAAGGTAAPLLRQLDDELQRMRINLSDTVEQYELSTQELKATNEELQAINEELRSATEELETSREELQSINEELITVNHELKSKVDELAHANSDMQNLMDATNIGTVFLDRGLRVMRYTPSAVGLFNLIPGDIGRPLADLSSRLNYAQLADDAASVLARLIPIEREVGRDDGQWFLARLLPYRAAEDRIAGVVLSFVNITERKQAEEVSQWLSAVVSSSVDAIISFSLEGVILSWNGGAQRIFGYRPAEAIGQSVELLLSEGSPVNTSSFLERVADRQSIEQVEMVFRAKNGAEVQVALTASPIVDARGRIVGGTATARDIGEARRARESLRLSEERLRLLIESARDYAIFSMDEDRVITSWNTGAQRLLGYAEAEAVGRLGDIIFTDEDRAAHAPETEAATATLQERAADERYHLRKDGTRFWGSGTLMRMRDPSGDAVGFVKILRDETAARLAQKALERSQSELLEALRQNEEARAELEAADRSKDRFIAVLSHEIRNPLASMTSAAALLTSPATPADERSRAAQIVERQARSMKVLVDDLLDVSRLAVGQLELRQVDVTLASLVDAAVETARPLIDSAGHQLVVDVPTQPWYVHVDPLRVGQALVNLLTNAARYTPPGGHIAVTAELENDDQGMVVITVADDGMGMAAETIDRMFELYSQGPAAAHRPNEGLGVGLALVRNIVKLHGGHVDASSDGPGKGSRFCIFLPLVQAPPASASLAAGNPKAAETGAARSLEALRILIVDDNTDASWTLARLLQVEGHKVRTASSGAQALDMTEASHPDVAILDIGMPGMSGIELAEQLRARPWATGMALVALTGWGESDSDGIMAQRFDACLSKPVELPQLLDTIAQALMQRRQP